MDRSAVVYSVAVGAGALGLGLGAGLVVIAARKWLCAGQVRSIHALPRTNKLKFRPDLISL